MLSKLSTSVQILSASVYRFDEADSLTMLHGNSGNVNVVHIAS